MKRLITVFLLVLLTLFLAGCNTSHIRPDLKYVLKRNPSLKQVVNHCEGNEEKMQAAEFLLTNLPYYYSYSDEDVHAYLKQFEYHGMGVGGSAKAAKDAVMREYGRVTAVTSDPIPDMESVSAEYLIDNIEWAFKVREEQPWSRNVSFEDFCEYVLPYRIGDECLKPWREKLYNKYNPMLDDIRHLPEAQDPLFVSKVLIDSVARETWHHTMDLEYGPHIGPDVTDWKAGNCRERTDWLMYIFRAVGLPCGCDYLPVRADGNVTHYWNCVFDKEGASYYMYPDEAITPVTGFEDERSKIHRQTFSLNVAEQDRIRGRLSEVHPRFRRPFFEDVTREYRPDYTSVLTVPRDELMHKVGRNEIVYLCSTSYMEWVPVEWAYAGRDSISFKDIHGDVILCLAVYRDKELFPVSRPFKLDMHTRAITWYHADCEPQSITLVNKFHQFFEHFPQRMIGGTFEGSDYPDFREKDTLHIITEHPLRLHNVVKLPQSRPYRYVRYCGPADGYCNVSEVAFYSASDSEPLRGTVIGTPNGEDGDKEHDYVNVYDGNPSTSFNYDHPSGGWAGLDLKSARPIDRIVYTARNRENYIYAGDTYELFYASDDGWQSAGMQVAVSDSLVYTVPADALMYLKNHSGGSDERIFEYKDGKQVYW